MFLIAIGGIIGLVIGGIFLLFILSFLFWAISKHNAFRRMEVKIDESASDIDVALNRRYDLLTKEYEICKGYAKQESSVLEEVSRLRSLAGKSAKADIDTLSKMNAGLDRLQNAIQVTLEQYPTLKSDQVFLHLMDSCRDVEDHLEASRRLYNSNVSIYNQEIVVFPSSLIASLSHCQKRELFRVEEGKEKDVPMAF